MKSQDFIMPAALALLAAGWLAWQRAQLSHAVGERTALQEQVAARQHGGSALPGREAGGRGRDGVTSTGGRLREIARKLGSGSGGDAIYDQLSELLLPLSAEELAAVLRELARMDLPVLGKEEVLGKILEMLTLRDPKAAIKLCDLMRDDERNGRLFHQGAALKRWAELEPAAAVAWLDQRISEGKLKADSADGTNPSRRYLEQCLAETTMMRDPSGTAARLSRLPFADLRELSLNSYLSTRREVQAWTQMMQAVRTDAGDYDLPTSVMLKLSSNVNSWHGLDAVGVYLDDIQTSPSQREIVTRAASKDEILMATYTSRENLTAAMDASWAWLQKVDPEAAPRNIASALVTAGTTGPNVVEAAGMAARYSREQNSDAILANFLDSPEIRATGVDLSPFIDQLSDPALREQLHQKSHQPAASLR